MNNSIFKALKWVVFWFILAFLFNIGVWIYLGSEKALEFMGGYLIELSLSIDNLFVFILIFTTFKINNKARHKVLHYGIIGAIVLRFLFIFFGLKLVSTFEFILYILGGILIINGIFMLREEEEKDINQNPLMRLFLKIIPIDHTYTGDKFITKINKKTHITPLLLILCLIEFSDILFAIDSVPAIFSISTNLFIIYVSNIFAIASLRQLYFVLEYFRERFKYVKYGVGLILVFTGIKLVVLMFNFHISTIFSICFIFSVIILSIIISYFITDNKKL